MIMSHPQTALLPSMGNITAVLGPTNTGKTHLAIERMLAHKSGMIGLPLRLLAREIYDRCRKTHPHKVFAFITGEEKILPPDCDYYICTVESMPSDRNVEFMAIDEIQMCNDLERGHIFTDRLLHWRGSEETMLLGADTIKPLLLSLLPQVTITSRPRLSKLSYGGVKKISRLPRQTAIVAFNSEKIYAIAELVRRQKGGAAVVMGSLSPRTRNAQVELFQSGDVPYLVATDAIGMGLNMDLEHVAFAATRKFDGKTFRDLSAAEMAQIAGRAGRHTNEGTFGTTADCAPFCEQILERIEDHKFETLKTLFWRNTNLDFTSLDGLKTSLLEKAPHRFLHRPLSCSDSFALEELSKQDEISDVSGNSELLKKLWDVCQIPDYRNISPYEHCHLLGTIFTFLMGEKGTLPEDWLSREVTFADRSEGDIDTLANRLAHIRTWTYVANRHDWLEDSLHWQGKTRAIEDKLSDALHQRLMARFIDRKTSLLMKRLRQREDVKVSLMEDGKIVVENEEIGALKAFQFEADQSGTHSEGKGLKSASSDIISEELKKRAEAFLGDNSLVLELGDDTFLRWGGHIIAKLKAGDGPLKMTAEFICDDYLTPDLKQQISAKIQKWLDDHLAKECEPLFALSQAEDIDGLAKGVAFQLVEARGMLTRPDVADDIKALDQDARKQLRKYGVRFGAFHIYMPALLKPAPAKLLLLFWALNNDISDIPTQPPNGLTSLTADMNVPEGFYPALGYKVCGTRAARIDMLERLADMIRAVIFWRSEKEGDVRPEGSYETGGFTVTPDMMSLLGCSGEEFSAVLTALGYHATKKKVLAKPVEVPETQQASKLEDSPAPSETPQDTLSDTEEPVIPQDVPQEENKPAEEDLVEVWLPHKKNNAPARRNKKKPAQKQARPQKNTGDKKKQRAQKKQPPMRPEDSPFAALLALKNQQAESNSDQ